MNIDFNKILEEDKELADWCSEVILEMVINNSPDMLPILFSLYQSGVSASQASSVFKTMTRIQ